MKKILIAILVLGAIGAGIGYYMAQKGHDSTADAEAVHSADCDYYVQSFLDDQQGSSAKYVDKVIEVTGPVFEINKADGKVTGVKIGKDEFMLVNCTFQGDVDASKLDGMIRVKGHCSGFMGDSESMLPGGTVEMQRCVLVE